MSNRPDWERATVLVVEDEPGLLEIYGDWLADAYDVRRAGNGMTAMKLVDDSIDVVLLDRRMPDMSGDEVLARIREAGYDCNVAMVTAVDPDVDIAEMGFDDYVRKPVTSDDLHDLVERLIERRSYDQRVQEYLAVVSKLVTLDAADEELADTERYRELVERKRRLRADIEGLVGALDDDFEAAVEELDRREE